MNSESIHTVPVPEDDHVCDGLMCWCVPRYYLPCDECGDADGLAAIVAGNDPPIAHSFPNHMRSTVGSCWKCVDQLIELTVAEAEACTQPLIIVHNR